MLSTYTQSSDVYRRLRNLTANPLKYKPAVNQVELNFWNPQPELVKVRASHSCAASYPIPNPDTTRSVG